MLRLQSIAANFIPEKYLYPAYIWKQRLLQYKFLGNKYTCNICHTNLRRFISLPEIADGLFMKDLKIRGKKYPVTDYETLNIENFLCPVCGSQDKARLYDIFITQKFKKARPRRGRSTFIHFAPEGGLPERIKKYTFLDYKTADLLRSDVDMKADLTKLQFRDTSVDYFICSHVLEHIPDDQKAMQELFRVMRPGGWGILTVPILSSLPEIYEDSSKVSEAQRLRHFGQADHVRVYSKKGFIDRLLKTGFYVTEYTASDFKSVDFNTYGITRTSILYVVTKK